MTVHNKKFTHLSGGTPGVVLECSCGEFTKTATGGSRKACEERLDYEFEQHLQEVK